MDIKNVKVYGLEESIIRSGYPMQVGEPEEISSLPFFEDSWDSNYKRGYKLANTLNGSGHNNFLKGIIVQFDLQYPEYFSPQLQRYHWIDIVSSQSKMHRITSRELTKEDFTASTSSCFINKLNNWIWQYNNENNYPIELFGEEDIIESKEELFQTIISNLPSGYLKWMGISTNYLQLKTIYSQRKTHKLSEWRYFCGWVKSLPMSELITGETKNEKTI